MPGPPEGESSSSSWWRRLGHLLVTAPSKEGRGGGTLRLEFAVTQIGLSLTVMSSD